MKLIILLLTFGFINTVNSEERMDMVCTVNSVFEQSAGDFKKLSPSEHSLIIFPETYIYIYDGSYGSYSFKGNSLVFTIESTPTMKSEIIVDRTTGLYKELWHYDYDAIKETEPYAMFIGKCKVTENLF
jgi:hypothetical protein